VVFGPRLRGRIARHVLLGPRPDSAMTAEHGHHGEPVFPSSSISRSSALRSSYLAEPIQPSGSLPSGSTPIRGVRRRGSTGSRLPAIPQGARRRGALSGVSGEGRNAWRVVSVESAEFGRIGMEVMPQP
jgi:hypothetical protein